MRLPSLVRVCGAVLAPYSHPGSRGSARSDPASPHGHGERWSNPARASAQLRLRARARAERVAGGVCVQMISKYQKGEETQQDSVNTLHVNTSIHLGHSSPSCSSLPWACRQAAWLLPHTYAPPMAPPFPSAARAEVGGHAVRTRSLVPTSQHIRISSRHADLAG